MGSSGVDRAKLGIGTAQTLLSWVRKDQVDTGKRPGVTTEMAEELRRLRAENPELKRANEILKQHQRLRGGTVRHEAPGVSIGGERPYWKIRRV